MKRISLAIGCLLTLALNGFADLIVYNDGGTHTIDTVLDLDDWITVQDSVGGNPTTLKILSDGQVGSFNDVSLLAEGASVVELHGGSLDEDARLYDTTKMDVHSGDIYDDLFAYDSSTVNFFDGFVGDFLVSRDTSTVNFFDGEVGNDLESYQSSTINFSGGEVLFDLQAFDDSTVNVTGGLIDEDLEAKESSTVYLHDGSVTENLRALNDGQLFVYGGEFATSTTAISGLEAIDQGVITLFGTEFKVDGVDFMGSITGTSGNVSGTLADGTAFDVPFVRGIDAQINLQPVPEPTSISLCGVAAIAIACSQRIRRRKR